MACCALAVFLIGQLYIVCETVARWLGVALPQTRAAGAADWRPGTIAAIRPARPWFERSALRRIGFAMAVSATALAVFQLVQPRDAASRIEALLHHRAAWCFAGRI